MPITNCHIHIFTQNYVPNGFPPFPLNLLSRPESTRRLTSWVLRSIWPFSNRDKPHRYANFMNIAAFKSQKDVFLEILKRYPLSTKFIVLPMDLRGMRRGRIKHDLRAQHEELAALAREYPDNIIPFVHIDPRSASEFGGPSPVAFIEEFLGKGFKGIKLYPPLGYGGADDIVHPIYDYAHTQKVPVMTHCSRGGVRDKRLRDEDAWRMTAPYQYAPILKKYPDMKLCLAHFGGADDWQAYLDEGWLGDKKLQEMNWFSQIATMLRSGDYPNLYTDISYTIFRFQELIPLMKVFLSDPAVRKRTLFGSDYFMSEREKMREREMAIRFRADIGEALFWELAETNPAAFLA